MALFLPVSGQLIAFATLTLATGLVFFVLTRRSVDSSSRASKAASKAKAAMKAVPMAAPSDPSTQAPTVTDDPAVVDVPTPQEVASR